MAHVFAFTEGGRPPRFGIYRGTLSGFPLSRPDRECGADLDLARKRGQVRDACSPSLPDKRVTMRVLAWGKMNVKRRLASLSFCGSVHRNPIPPPPHVTNSTEFSGSAAIHDILEISLCP